jgi:hypothetical protein
MAPVFVRVSLGHHPHVGRMWAPINACGRVDRLARYVIFQSEGLLLVLQRGYVEPAIRVLWTHVERSGQPSN